MQTIITQISECIEKSFNLSGKNYSNKIIVFPCGDVGMQAVSIMNTIYGIKPAYVIDNHKCKFNPSIKPSDYLSELAGEDYVILLASINWDIYADLKQKILSYFPEDKILELSQNIGTHIVKSQMVTPQLNDANTLEYYNKMLQTPTLFKLVEIETINRCNGVCEFCGVSANAKQRPFAKMTETLFKKIIDELSELNYKGYLSLFSNNEPFLDERIVEFAKYARQKVPLVHHYLFTNGTVVTEEKYIEIMHYLDRMHVDVYIHPEDEEPEYVRNIKRWASRNRFESKMSYQYVSPDCVRESRGGTAPNKKSGSLEELCKLPLLQMVIRPDGKVSLCCNDALGQMTLGDVNEKSLQEIWFSDEYSLIREKQ